MRIRLIASFIFVMVVSIASVTIIARRSTVREVQAFMFRGTMTELDTLASDLEAYYQANGSWQGITGLLPGAGQGLRRGQSGQAGMVMGMMTQRLRLANAAGEVIADTSGADVGNMLNTTERSAAQPLRVNGRLVGYLLLEGGMGLNDTNAAFLFTRINRAALIAALIAGGIALVLALVLSDRLIQPIRRLTQAAARLAQGDLSHRVPVQGNDELAKLGVSFNYMADSLQQAEEARRAMTADIAHELRTPLAVQRAHLEALQDGIFDPTQENIQSVLDQNLLLTRLVDDLRTLALADAGQLQLEKTPVDFAALVQRIVERFTPQAAKLQVELVLTVPTQIQTAPPVLNLDAGRIEQIIGNILSNALRYSPEGSQIKIDLLRSATSVQVRIQDGGPGIPPEALEHIFERFYRADRARSRAEGGSGLGLAIAKELAEMHGGTLNAANAPEGGAIFILSLPLS
jgi:two-component system sensor histidine kinase BaeS